jgi:hypothetical protein
MSTSPRVIDVQTAPATCRVCGQVGLCNCPLCVENKRGELNICSKCADRKKKAAK